MGKCEHGLYRCKNCGKGYCEHGIQHSRCKECGGSSICEHYKRRSRCSECGGGEICEHKKNRDYCKECEGSQICEHGKERAKCKECGGSQICKHNKHKAYCKDCEGSQICEHLNIRHSCKECMGSQICEHKVNKHRCKECRGNAYCEHDKLKAQCKECNGSRICKHKKRVSRCKECDGSELCKSEWCEIMSNSKYEGYCLFCFMHLFPDKPLVRNYKTKERTVVENILDFYPEIDWIPDKRVLDGCSKRRPDLLADFGDQILIIEVDENQHNGYDCSCENKRLMEISKDLGHRPIVFIRFNPDDYIEYGVKIPSPWKAGKDGIVKIKGEIAEATWSSRLKVLRSRIDYWVEYRIEQTIYVENLFFDSK